MCSVKLLTVVSRLTVCAAIVRQDVALRTVVPSPPLRGCRACNSASFSAVIEEALLGLIGPGAVAAAIAAAKRAKERRDQ